MLVLLSALLVFIASTLYLLITFKHGYWKKRNIPCPSPTFFGGNIGETLTIKKNLGDVYAEVYQKYDKYPFVGIYKVLTPALLIRDPELIKEVVLKNFSNFYDNSITFHEGDPLIGRNPFVLKGQKWKTFRNQLTPLFTSAKVKSALAIFNDSGQKLVDYIAQSKEVDYFEAKDIAIRYSVNNVVSYSLGVDAKTFEDENSEFKRISYELFQVSVFQVFKPYIAMIFPTISKYFKMGFTSPSTEKRFKAIVSDSIKYRIENNVLRNDMLSSMISMRNSGAFTDHDIANSVGALYIDGVETSSLTLNYLLYELAAHPWTQEELKKEIDEVLDKYGGSITYEAIQEMKYLDAAFNEALRLHPTVPFMDRLTTQKTKLTGTTKDGKQIDVSLDVGVPVIVSMMGLHHDEAYYPEPNAFKPERFLLDSKANIPKFAFLPFGEGPRICLGKMFGTIQVKTATVHVLKNYRLSLGNKVPYPIEVDAQAFILNPKQPIMIKFRRWK